MIVNIHGGPEGQFQPGYLGRYNYLLNELGMAMIFPNVRGSTGYGKTFLNLDNGRKREDSVKDIGALLDWIAARPDLDARRVMVTGGSYGGYMTLASMTHFNDRFRCAVDVVGISNWITFLEHTEAYRRDLRRVEYGDERDPEMRKFLESISPIAHVDQHHQADVHRGGAQRSARAVYGGAADDGRRFARTACRCGICWPPTKGMGSRRRGIAIFSSRRR